MNGTAQLGNPGPSSSLRGVVFRAGSVSDEEGHPFVYNTHPRGGRRPACSSLSWSPPFDVGALLTFPGMESPGCDHGGDPLSGHHRGRPRPGQMEGLTSLGPVDLPAAAYTSSLQGTQSLETLLRKNDCFFFL